ncbi:hypothetical protein, partial [Klebsiella pneumoniae]|uniref:hypothetical protein n=1 Tax=Klebsiella pneumoniae TaxID=573 RepID=UPI001CD99BA8
FAFFPASGVPKRGSARHFTEYFFICLFGIGIFLYQRGAACGGIMLRADVFLSIVTIFVSFGLTFFVRFCQIGFFLVFLGVGWDWRNDEI